MSDSFKHTCSDEPESSCSSSEDYQQALRDVEQAREALRKAQERLDKATEQLQQQASQPSQQQLDEKRSDEQQPDQQQVGQLPYQGSVEAPPAPPVGWQPVFVQMPYGQQFNDHQAASYSEASQPPSEQPYHMPSGQQYQAPSAQPYQPFYSNGQAYGNYQQPMQPQPPYNQMPVQPHYAAPYVSSKDHVAAGLLAIFLGFLGVHKFYLGYSVQGFIMLAISVIGGPLLFGLPFGVMWVIAIVEGVIYLMKSQTEFEKIYVYSKREWF